MYGILYEMRPTLDTTRKPRSLFLAGAGLGLIGGLVGTKLFTNDNSAEISEINEKLEKQSKLLKITNQRIDILNKNVSQSVAITKEILKNLIKTQAWANVHSGIQWNLDQLISTNTEILNDFRLAELTLTLLDNGILNPDLIKIDSLKATVEEGKKLFPDLTFPLDVSRFHLHNIVKFLQIQRVGRMHFLIIIPFIQKTQYDLFSLIPQPMKLNENTLAIPKTKIWF